MLGQEEKEKSCFEKCLSFIKQVDAYGVPVSLTFKSEPYIKSTVGGCFTLLARLLIVIYLAN